jgi:hypothetical protein
MNTPATAQASCVAYRKPHVDSSQLCQHIHVHTITNSASFSPPSQQRSYNTTSTTRKAPELSPHSNPIRSTAHTKPQSANEHHQPTSPPKPHHHKIANISPTATHFTKTMTAIVEVVITATLVLTIAAIMAAHHTEERLTQRSNKNGNRYHRLDQKNHRLQARLAGRGEPDRHYCKYGHPLD